MKIIPSINHAASFGGIVCNTSDCLMIYFRKDAFSDCLSFPSGNTTDKGTVVIGNEKASSGFRDLSATSPNA